MSDSDKRNIQSIPVASTTAPSSDAGATVAKDNGTLQTMGNFACSAEGTLRRMNK